MVTIFWTQILWGSTRCRGLLLQCGKFSSHSDQGFSFCCAS